MDGDGSKYSCTMPAALITLFVLGFQKAAVKPISVSDLVKGAAKYDTKVVSVVGKVDKYDERVAKQSKKPYTVMTLSDGKNTVNVYMKNKPTDKVKKGDKVTVTGVYSKEKKVGSNVFKNEIDASNDKEKSHGVKITK